jgi:DNA N-6-adenine-methyltransferase (Dam)
MTKNKRKARNARLLSSKHHDYQTPEYFLQLVRKVAPIGLDPATNPQNPTGARCFIAPPQDGRGALWQSLCRKGHLVYINPPYGGALKLWSATMAAQVVPDALDHYMQLALVPARVDAAWFRLLCQSADRVLFWSSPTLGSRIRFARPAASTGKKTVSKRPDGAMFPCAVFFWGPPEACERFEEVFGPHGMLLNCRDIQFHDADKDDPA